MSEQDQEVAGGRSRRALPIRLTRRAGRSVPCGGAARLVAPSLMVTRSCVCLSARTCAGSAAASRAPPRSATGARSGHEVYSSLYSD